MRNWLDGKKRYLLLIVFVIQAVLQMAGHGDIVRATQYLISLIGWAPSDAIVSSAVIAQLVAAVYAIYDGWRKDRAARARLNR